MSVFEELPILKEYNRALFHGDGVQKWVEIMDKEATSINSLLIAYSFFQSLGGVPSGAKQWGLCVTVCTEH